MLGIHTNMAGAVPPHIDKAAFTGAPRPPGLSAEETRAYDQAYALEMGSRPQTLYGIADSPVGLAAWILDHDTPSLELITRVFDGRSEGLTRDDVLDNITHYWLTNTADSSSRLYWENKLAFFAPKGVAIPVAVSVFPNDIDAPPRSWAGRALCGLGTADTLLRRGSRGLQVTAQVVAATQYPQEVSGCVAVEAGVR